MKRLLTSLLGTWLFSFAAIIPAYRADSTSFDPTTVQVTAKGSGGVPVGSILAWPVAKNPPDMSNWLECNGQSITQSAFPELFAVVGVKVPDLRGYFLRGHGGNSAGLGLAQSDAIRNIKAHWYVYKGSEDCPADGAVSATLKELSWANHTDRGMTELGDRHMYFDASRVVPVANENRLINCTSSDLI